ncbi:hypothetical protein M2454_001898 [Aequitasia blattaphilus]|uniref:Uncharacterized protein n=1 Tax=Aequitasia blattaphilus TaxID=2949332 RepID=A0ABT1E9S9_9FIRM|nr:hypothetical protein [Aequitasia blattaphilus]MCP1102586.1 hypothetical protein [Aequitasia blattaphilus]MCR8615226.1 hypothetical protein [Aequitasia blattaphilus]
MPKNINVYDYENHIVQIIKNDGTVITGLVDECELEIDNDEGDALLVYEKCQHLPFKPPKQYPLELVFVSDIKEIDIIE